MNRRELLTSLPVAAGTVLAAATAGAESRPVVLELDGRKLAEAVLPSIPGVVAKKYGAVNAQTHLAHRRLTGEFLRVYLDGEDVTSVCRFADDRGGYVELTAKDEVEFTKWHAKGGYYISYSTVHVDGDVVMRPGAPL